MTSIDDLPEELLLQILEYLPADSLSMTVPLVSTQWRALSQRISLWKHVTFTPPISMSDEEVAGALRTMPHLKSFRLQHGEDIDYIVDILCQHCPEIRHIVMERKRGPSKEMISKLLSRYKDIECLDVPVPGSVFQIDFAKVYGLPCLGPTSFTALGPDGLRWFDSRIRNESVLYNPSLEDINRILRAGKDTLKYLTIFAKITSKEMNMIYECKHLRSLLLYGGSSDVINLDVNSLTKLKNLESLHLCIYSLTDLEEIRVEGDLPLLVKLEIISWHYFSNLVISFMFNICPNLQYINLHTIGLRDECFINMNICQRLKHIDISSNFLLTGMAVKHIADKCPQLQFLDVSFCPLMTEDIINILSKLKHLEELRLDYQDFSVQCFLSIPAQLPTLSTLSVKQCDHFDTCVIKELETNFPNLKLLK